MGNGQLAKDVATDSAVETQCLRLGNLGTKAGEYDGTKE